MRLTKTDKWLFSSGQAVSWVTLGNPWSIYRCKGVFFGCVHPGLILREEGRQFGEKSEKMCFPAISFHLEETFLGSTAW